ncbi:hypothetical protein J3Q64DRAFT_1726487 [Phycomyces blakesleeanus]|uniref:Uncharacterized protein n=1 Tax=Phycomyces blakesleeanus TaxID=4837 RepID=A0ABR3B8K9_PHYBL
MRHKLRQYLNAYRIECLSLTGIQPEAPTFASQAPLPSPDLMCLDEFSSLQKESLRDLHHTLVQKLNRTSLNGRYGDGDGDDDDDGGGGGGGGSSSSSSSNSSSNSSNGNNGNGVSYGYSYGYGYGYGGSGCDGCDVAAATGAFSDMSDLFDTTATIINDTAAVAATVSGGQIGCLSRCVTYLLAGIVLGITLAIILYTSFFCRLTEIPSAELLPVSNAPDSNSLRYLFSVSVGGESSRERSSDKATATQPSSLWVRLTGIDNQTSYGDWPMKLNTSTGLYTASVPSPCLFHSPTDFLASVWIAGVMSPDQSVQRLTLEACQPQHIQPKQERNDASSQQNSKNNKQQEIEEQEIKEDDEDTKGDEEANDLMCSLSSPEATKRTKRYGGGWQMIAWQDSGFETLWKEWIKKIRSLLWIVKDRAWEWFI